MTKQRNIIVWAILILLATSCSPPAASCSSSVQIYDLDSAAPGETVFLTLTKTGFGWDYSWSTTAGNFDDPHASSTAFTAPDDEKTVTVTVEVEDEQGCAYTDKIEIEVMKAEAEGDDETDEQETAVAEAPTATITVEATPMHTDTPAPTVEPSATPEPSPLPAPTETPTEAPSATKPPLPTSTPQPVLVNPVIIHHEILPGSALTLAWDWEDELGPDQNFAVRFWSKADPRPEARYSITWTKERMYQFSVAGYPAGEYYMNVAVMIGPSVGEHFEVVRSQDVLVYVPPIPTTLPPP